MIAMLYK